MRKILSLSYSKAHLDKRGLKRACVGSSAILQFAGRHRRISLEGYLLRGIHVASKRSN